MGRVHRRPRVPEAGHGDPGAQPAAGRPAFLTERLRDPSVRDDVAAARALGISYRRFTGWEPTTTYTYDDDGRLISSQPEPEWDDTERDWMLALAAWEREEVCPLCGWPKDVCQARDTENALDVPPPTRCHVTTAIRRAQEARRAGPAAKHDDALLWGAQVKGQLER